MLRQSVQPLQLAVRELDRDRVRAVDRGLAAGVLARTAVGWFAGHRTLLSASARTAAKCAAVAYG